MNDAANLRPDEDAAMEAAALWCIRLAEDDLAPAEWDEFEAWLALPGHADLLQDAARVWRESGAIGDWPEIIALRSKALSQFRQQSQKRWLSGTPGPLRRGAAWAAMLLLAVATAGMWYVTRPDAIETGVGERRVALLDDGSHVSLDATTSMTVRMKDEARQIELVEGRAKFDVAKDPLRPFTVAAGDKLIVAVGTSFSVELVDGEVRVILYEGQVEVRDRADTTRSAVPARRRLMMTAGSELVDTVGSAAPPQVSRPDLSQTLSWELGLISFDDEPLAGAVERMNRYSARRIRLADPTLGAIRVDGMFRAGDVDAFVEGVTALHPVRQRIVGDEVVLESR
ncbi:MULTISPECIES: FecR family protein [unclassified Sphingopyxis]|uniref:FecR family protein n=1 Tax=Sphingopyxis sp. DBS4 TaxID=2968500 RepID=UPI00214D0B7C|nr:FecR domain-containing protein [Sphingopyxis sp. DBS4]